jgi:hypothetical protein
MSGARLVTLTDVGHRALPVAGRYVSERTGQPAVLTDESCYPVTARCKACGGPIRLAVLMQWEWVHVAMTAAETAPASPVDPARGEPGAGEYPPAPGGLATTANEEV